MSPKARRVATRALMTQLDWLCEAADEDFIAEFDSTDKYPSWSNWLSALKDARLALQRAEATLDD